MVLRRLWSDANEMSKAAYGGAGKKELLRLLLTNDSYRIMVTFRLRELARKLRVPGANHILRMLQTAFFSIELNNDIELGDGVYFIHPIGVVVGGDSKVGSRVRFYGNNTLGTAKENGYPIIEDDVSIGAGARILGPVRVGARSFIGANAVVLQDVPPDSIAVGIPATIKPKTTDQN